MNTLLRICRRLFATALFAAASLSGASATAAPLPFDALVSGQSDIVAVLDPNGPVVRIETAARGLGSLGALRYFSADEVNLASGRGTGNNRFVADDGSELFGVFTVQLVPTADPAVLELFGDVDFTGGSGRFAGADGSARFTGVGTFISAVTALSRFDFRGELLLVPEPSSLALCLAAIWAVRLSALSRCKPAGSARRRGHSAHGPAGPSRVNAPGAHYTPLAPRQWLSRPGSGSHWHPGKEPIWWDARRSAGNVHPGECLSHTACAPSPKNEPSLTPSPAFRNGSTFTEQHRHRPPGASRLRLQAWQRDDGRGPDGRIHQQRRSGRFHERAVCA